jgi:16S rRNA (cytosine967-C5)-methyltransferase
MKAKGSGPRIQGPASGRPVGGDGFARVSPARRVAFEILRLVGLGKGHSDELLHSKLTEGLSAEDRGLATALVMGVLRRQIALDAQARGLLQRPEQRLAEPVILALRMGAFQLLHMDRIPAHAALSESVELCKAAGEVHAAGMVNAILRKIAAAGKKGVPIHESTAGFAERLGHPAWLVERWVKAYGRAAAMKICEAGQEEPASGGMFVEEMGEGAERLPVMDDGSRLVAEIAAAAMPEAKRVWDCCAAPGGKTLVMARRLANAEVLATDISAKRMAMMESRLQGFGYATKVEAGVVDAADPKGIEGEFDLILCDVPCSGTGTLAGNPEIRHFLRLEELGRQADRQTRILKSALGKLAKGGRLVYSTCSLEREECEEVVDAVLEGASGAKRVEVDGLVEGLRESGILKSDLKTAVLDGALRTLPGMHGCDGFYAVVLER